MFDERVHEFGHETKVIKYQTNKENIQKMQWGSYQRVSTFPPTLEDPESFQKIISWYRYEYQGMHVSVSALALSSSQYDGPSTAHGHRSQMRGRYATAAI